ncbi:MAG: peptide deformylase [Clostridiales bacterium]|nr:peptide deformylase [Clostridiales bacterium]
MALRRILNERTDAAALRRKSRPVDIINNHIRTLLDDMAETLYDADGVGLAAPQVGVLRRVALVDVSEDRTGLIELINPEILEREGEQSDLEGCLSFTDLNGTVVRPQRVRVRHQDRDGAWQELSAEGYLARAVCHELDHLDGVLFVDLATDLFHPSERADLKKEA